MKRLLPALLLLLLLCLPLAARASYDFDGANDNLARAAALFTAYPFTVCGWSKATGGATESMFAIGSAGTVDNSWQLLFSITGSPDAAAVRTRTTSQVDTQSTNDYVEGSWNFNCIVASSSASVSIFQNGVLTAGNPALTPSAGNETKFGENNNDALDFTGSLGQWAAWDVALAEADLDDLYNGGTGGTNGVNPQDIDPTNLIAYWPMTADATDAIGSFDFTVTGATFDGADNPPVDDPAGACSGTPVITDVDTDESLEATQANFTITGTDFCATQGTGTVTLRQNGNSKTISGCAWSDTSLTGCDMSGAGMGVASGLLYGAADIRVTNDAANSDDQAITITAPSGTASVELGTLVDLTYDAYGNESRLHGGTPSTDPTSASQCARRNLSGLSAVTINSDGSIEATGTGTFDWDCTDNSGSGGSELYVGSYSAHPNCTAGSTVVCSVAVEGTPPLFGPTPIEDHVLAVGLAMTVYDVDDYVVAGEGAASARALRQLGSTTDTTADLDGAHADVSEIAVTDAVAHSSIVKGAWMRIGAGGEPVRIKYVDPVNNLIGLYALRSGSDTDAIITYANGAGSVSAVTVDSGTGAVSGTPDTDATTSLLTYRWTDDAGLIAESGPIFEIDVVTIPDVTADDQAGATATLEALGLGVTVDITYTLDEAAGEVLAQTPSSELFGSNVNLEVSGGNVPADFWVSYARVWMFKEVRRVYLTTTAFKEAVEAELRGAQVWARWAPGTNPWSGSSNMQIAVTIIPGVPPLNPNGTLQLP